MNPCSDPILFKSIFFANLNYAIEVHTDEITVCLAKKKSVKLGVIPTSWTA